MITKVPYRIAEIIKETPNVTIFRFQSVDGTKLDFTPGMFVMLNYKDPATGQMIARAFSIASVPGTDTLEFFISMVHGRFTSKLDYAKVGDIYYVSGPYGQFKLDNSHKKVLFIAGGTGLAPFMSMLRYINANHLDVDSILLYSVRYPNEIIRKSELEGFEKEMTFKAVVTVSRPQEGDGWTGEKGHIDSNMIARHVNDIGERECYICGPLAFTKAMGDALLSLNVESSRIRMDVWG